MFKLMAMAPFTDHLPRAGVAMPDQRALMAALRELLAAGKITPAIDRTFALAETPQALRYLMEGRARGKVVVTP
jgi:NADPH:quinone reductase-like Zn-dependent oxidoreductase